MKLKLFIVLSFLTIIFTLGCTNNPETFKTKEVNTEKPNIEESSTVKPNKLTLDEVKLLSRKGDKLSWEDFQTYYSTEIGSGLYILMYPVDDKYKILVGGANLKEKPMYIYLEDNNDNRIDIRYDDIYKFLNR